MFRLILLFMIFPFLLLAEAFHPYAVKSGKITYEKRKYSIHSTLKIDANGQIQGKRTTPYYVEEKVEYYWSDYGNLVYERSFLLSWFGGKKLEKPILKYETLWKGDKRHYYNAKKHKVLVNPYYMRIECLKAGKLFERSGWVKVLYPTATIKDQVNVEGEMTDHYFIDAFEDVYLWKGIVLREMDYSTSPKGERMDPDREKVAVTIDEKNTMDTSIFSPKWVGK
ncbi:hypothetical protein [Sulfurovum sp. NBC37-1]|uniref:hypothetical protein n=1 Tax=Sulfurovum sp. (strain NBC37-1) TaxID=387093 RepID=UPI0001587973|nr:hypothetical protein [Sulfurovum sp. NBC37-1]BAF72950.1 hypothetical protein SUN_2008 [Sulfurovum sp. NBC37-1]